MKKVLLGLMLVLTCSLCGEEVLRYKDMGDVYLLEEGDEIPVQVMAGGVLRIVGENRPLVIKLERSLFIRLREEDSPLFSLDMQDWKSFSEMFRGKVAAGIEPIEGGLEFSFGIDLDVRD